MKVRQLYTNLAKVMSVAVIATDPRCRDAYLAWRKKRTPHKAQLEDALETPNIEQFFRLEVMQPFLDQLESSLQRNEGIYVLEQQARTYFQVDEVEKSGISSHVFGEMEKTALPRLIARLHECPAEELEQDLGALLASLFSAEFQKVVEHILAFRMKTTDQVTIHLFA
jgi:hypothetical protein